MELCYIYCRDVSEENSEFYSLPIVRMAQILEDSPISLHALVIGEFDQRYLEEADVAVYKFDRWFPILGIVSLYAQLFVVTIYVSVQKDIDGFSNVWAHYNLLPVLLAGTILRRRVFARTFGMGSYWDRSVARHKVALNRPLYTLGILSKRLLNSGEAWLLNQAEAVYTNATSVRDILVEQGVDRDQLLVVSQGVDTDFFTPGEAPRRSRILFVGRVSAENKRPSDAYKVYRRVKSRRPDASLIIAGGGELPARLQAKLDSTDISHLGFLNRRELRSEYRRARALLVTSEKEGVPNVLLEAQACGLPVVATNAGDVPRVLSEGDGGVVHNVGDVESLADSVLELLENESRWCEMSKNGREYVERNHSFEVLRGTYIELFSPA